MKRRKKALFFGLVVLAFLLAAAFAPALTPFDPYEQNLEQALRAPDRVHLLGTDRYGRDLLSRVILGGRTSIFSALILVGITTFCGGAIGIFCGFYQGRLDGFFMRLSDIFLAFPGMVFAIAAASVMHGGIWNAILALALISWPKYARLTRSQVLGMKHTSYMAAAKLSGCSPVAVILRHVLPNICGPVVTTAVLDIGTMMMEIAGLSFLGLGATPPVPEWGSMMSNGRSMLQTALWVVLAPGFAIFFSVVVFHLFGDAVRDLLDPKQKQKTR